MYVYVCVRGLNRDWLIWLYWLLRVSESHSFSERLLCTSETSSKAGERFKVFY